MTTSVESALSTDGGDDHGSIVSQYWRRFKIYVCQVRFRQELIRTLIACAVLFLALTLTAFSQIISDQWFIHYSSQVRAHGLIKGKIYAIDPLWDILHFYLPDISSWTWGPDLTVGSYILICLVAIFIFPAKKRVKYQGIITFRRLVWITAILFLFRSTCHLATTVPCPQPHCTPANPQSYWEYLNLILKTLIGTSVACTDQIYSGHTTFTVALFLASINYGGRRLFTLYAFFHGIIAITVIVLTRIHYTVDVIVAIFITVFVYYTYHLLLLMHSDQHILHNQYINKERIIAAGEDPSYLEERRLIMRLAIKKIQRAMAWIDGLDIRMSKPEVLTLSNDHSESDQHSSSNVAGNQTSDSEIFGTEPNQERLPV